MEALYTTKTKITLDEIETMVKFSRRWQKYVTVPMMVFCIAMILFCLYFSMYLGVAVFVALTLAWAFSDRVTDKKTAKKMYNSNQSMQNIELTYSFFEDYMVQESEIGRTEIKYADLYKVDESKTRFYIRNSKLTAFIVVKENCSEELCEFIRMLKVK